MNASGAASDTPEKPGNGEDNGILVTWRQSSAAVKALMVGLFIDRLGAFLQIFLVLFLTARGFTELQAGIALGVYSGGLVVGTLSGGELTDRLGSRFTILIGMFGSAGLILGILYLDSYAALLAVIVTVGVARGFYPPAAKSLLSELTPKHRQVMIFAMYRLSQNLGTTAAPLIGAALVAVSYDLLFWVEAAAALTYAVIAWIALPRRARGTAGQEAASTNGGGGDYRAVLADHRYLLFLLALFVNAVVYIQYLSTLPLAMRAAGLSPSWFSAMVALNGFIVITCELLATKVVQRWPMRFVPVVGFVLLGGGLATYNVPLGVAAFVIGTLIWSFAEIVAGPTMFAYPALAGPERLRGRYLGTASATFNIGYAVGPVVGVVAWNLLGPTLWWCCGIVAAGGVVAAYSGMRPEAIAAARQASTTDGRGDDGDGDGRAVSSTEDTSTADGAGDTDGADAPVSPPTEEGQSR